MNEDEKQKSGGWKIFWKALGVISVVLMFLAVICFGMLVGACGYPGR